MRAIMVLLALLVPGQASGSEGPVSVSAGCAGGRTDPGNACSVALHGEMIDATG